MAPLRVALIGLSSSAKVTWAADAHLPYLCSTRGSKHYTLTALLNSSVSAAKAARDHFNLPASIKTYGDPEALAADPDIDLVAVNTRADVHFSVMVPSLRAGKRVFVEWPLVENAKRAQELVAIIDSSPMALPLSNHIIGLQGRVSPPVQTLKAELDAGVIGRVLSSEVHGHTPWFPRDALPETLSYFADRKVGGHQINIAGGHMLDYVHMVLGEFVPGSESAKFQIQRPQLKVIRNGKKQNEEGGVGKTLSTNVPDLMSIHGTLEQRERSVPIVSGAATLTVAFRTGPPFPGNPGMTWTIYGERGEIQLTAPGTYLGSDSYDGPVKIVIHDYASSTVREAQWKWEDWQEQFVVRGRSIAELYERYAEWVESSGVAGGSGQSEKAQEKGREWPTMGDAVERMEEFARLYRFWDSEW